MTCQTPPRTYALAVSKSTCARWLVLFICALLATTAVAQDRYRATNSDTLSFSTSIDSDLVSQMREGLDTYRSQLRGGEQLAVRPLTQQSAEIAILRDHLRSAGYYNAEIQPQPTDNYERLQYRITPNRRFVIRQIDWDWPAELDTPLEAESRLQPGMPLVAQNILTLQNQLRREIQNNSCYLRVNVRYELSLDRPASAGDIRFYMEPSTQVNIRELNVEGVETVRPSHARRLTGLEAGDCFQRPRLDRARLNLYESNLFARVDERVTEPDENNEVGVTYQVQERFHRTLKLGGGYDTDSGIGVSAEWAHRNFSGGGEHLTLNTQWSLLSQSVGASLGIPRRASNRPRMTFSTRFERSIFSGTPSYIWNKGVNLEQNLWPSWTGNLGANVQTSWTQGESITDFEQWLSLPASLVRDTRNNVLDPSDGSRLLFGFTPNYSLSGTQPHYGQARVSGRTYWPYTNRLTLAATSEATVLMGLGNELDLNQLSATERLYAGGGGSVRGWPFQGVPPTEGGRTRFVSSLEQRLRISENWGAAAFLDAAWLSREQTLDFDDGVYGVGLGVRYFTNFAPLRLDIGSPLDNIGRDLRFYISIGQAF